MSLARTQVLSLIAKGVTTVLGAIQTLIILRLLPLEEFGLVGLVMSIGAVIGVSQHLGIVDGTIREVAILKDRRDVIKVLWVSTLIRQAVTVPLSLVLLFFAQQIAQNIYHKPEIIPYIHLFAAVLILQGFQDVFGATLTGLKKFYALYFVQIITAALNIAAFGVGIWLYGTRGYFYAVIAMTTVMVGSFLAIITHELHRHSRLPSLVDMQHFGRLVMKTGAFMYASRIFFVIWQRLPILMLGGVLTGDQLGLINVALAFGGRLTIVTAALSEVNLSWMSSLFATRRETFEKIAARNMQRIFVFMALLTLLIVYFVPEIILIIGEEYRPAQMLIYIIMMAFFLYALLDIGTNSVLVAANRASARMWIYFVMTAIPAAIIAWLMIFDPSALLACLAVLLGVAVSYIGMVAYTARRFNIHLLNREQASVLGLLTASILWLLTDPSLILRLPIFFLIISYVVRLSVRSRLLPNPWAVGANTTAVRQAERTIICFAGAAYDQPSWTNRQHMMAEVSKAYPVFYVEPRIWIVRWLVRHWRQPDAIIKLFTRILAFEKKSNQLFIKSQWNLLPLSREYKLIAKINHQLNRFSVKFMARRLGFGSKQTIVWIYDTEAAAYVPDFPGAYVLYDCVDDHAAQAGVDRNPTRVAEEEAAIIARADVVTVTSKKLYDVKRQQHPNTHLVLNAGDVKGFIQTAAQPIPNQVRQAMAAMAKPIVGCVGALDSYKLDFDMLFTAAQRHPAWQFVFIGEPVVDGDRRALAKLQALPNVHLVGAVDHTQVPWYVSFFDVCLIPYRSSRYNEASFPLKFWEFMVTGKPLVVSGLPELEEYQHLIGYARSPDEFIEKIKIALANPGEGHDQRMALARGHTWQNRVDQILALMPPV